MTNIYLLNDKMREEYKSTIREIKEEKRYERKSTKLAIKEHKRLSKDYQKRLNKRLKAFRNGKIFREE